MLAFILRRAALIVPTFFGVTLLAFALIRLIPGDPVETLSGERGIDPERHAAAAARVRPRPAAAGAVRRLRRQRAARRSRHVARSRTSRCWREFLTLFPATVELALLRDAVRASSIGLPAGILAAVKRNTVADYAVMGVSLTGYSMPIFWWGAAADPVLLGAARLDAGLGPHRRRSSTSPPVTGFMLIDTLLLRRAGRVPLGAVAPDPAGDRARHDPAGGDRAHDALVDARGAARGLRAHRARQGPAALRVVVRARAAQRADPGGHGDRPAGRRCCSPARSSPRRSSPGRASATGWSTAISRATTRSVQGGILLIATIVISVNLIVDLLYGVDQSADPACAERR